MSLSVSPDYAYHRPVLLAACVEALALAPGGTYVDVTFGGGGHSRALLAALPEGARLVAFDQDPDAARQADQLRAEMRASGGADPDRFLFIQANFRDLAAQLQAHGVGPVQGVLADLGVSSHQFDTAARGFSTRFDGPLDMRMSQHGPTAAELVRDADEAELHRIFGMYGEVTNARTLARAVVAAREARQPLDTVAAFKKATAGCVMPRGKENKYFAQVFQALRIAINDEMGALQSLLLQAADVLAPGARLVVLAYHSLEDRLVKNVLAQGRPWGEAPKDVFGHPQGLLFKPLLRKPGEADAAEVALNPRARSARLRVGERLPVASIHQNPVFPR